MLKQLLFFISLIALVGCSDSSSPTPEPAFPIGKWQWIETTGGIAGVHLTPATEGYACMVNFQSQTHAAVYRNDTLVQSGEIALTTSDSISYLLKLGTGFSQTVLLNRLPSVVLMDSSVGVTMHRSNDSIMVYQEGVADGFLSLFVKQK